MAINTSGGIPTSIKQDGDNMADMGTPSNADYIASSFKEYDLIDVYIDHFNDDHIESDFRYKIKLVDGHWFSICNDVIYCSLGKPYYNFTEYDNYTKYKILQSSKTAICGGYAILFVLGSKRFNDPLAYFDINDKTHFVPSQGSSYEYDLRNKDIYIRNNNDIFVADTFNRVVTTFS